MNKNGQISKLAPVADLILEKRGDPEPTKKSSGVGEWSGDNLIVSVYSMDDIINRVMQAVGVKKGSPKDKQLRKNLPALIKKDKNFTTSIVDIMADSKMSSTEKADLLDTNIDEFFETHNLK